MAEAHSEAALVAHQFDDFQQQSQADSLGMWIFLATEVLFFGGLFCGYALIETSTLKPSRPEAIFSRSPTAPFTPYC